MSRYGFGLLGLLALLGSTPLRYDNDLELCECWVLPAVLSRNPTSVTRICSASKGFQKERVKHFG